MRFSRELKRLVHPHYLLNFILAISFVVSKQVNAICHFLYDSCEFTTRESNILFFILVIIAFRTRKQGAVNILPYLETACMFAKLGNVILFFSADPVYGILFTVLALLHFLLLPEPSYRGPEHILYFKHQDLLNALSESARDPVTNYWLIELYTSWSPACIDFASAFSELSAKYSLDNFKFGKVDLARNEDTALKYKINTSPMSKQLPTLILFKNGEEQMRRPLVDYKGKLVKFPFGYENVVNEYDLNNIYDECKNKLSAQASKRKGKRSKEALESDSHPKAE